MVGQVEANANNALGALLRGMLPRSVIRAEHAGLLTGSGGRPDLLITGPGGAPVVIEAEYEPARTVEKEARSRLDLGVADEPRPVESAIAVRYPAGLKDEYELEAPLRESRLAFAVFHADGTRFPETGWLEGSVGELSDLIRVASVPRRAFDRAADLMEQGIERSSWSLKEAPGSVARIAKLLGMPDVEQTRRMACAILANAVVFHHRLAGITEGVTAPRAVCGDAVNLQKPIREEWTRILAINYWPIFAIARDILDHLLAGVARRVLERLFQMADEMDALGVTNAHDLTGRIFQRLIADRKYLATFYTLPASASLLARLAVSRLDEVDWSDTQRIGQLRVGDFACGTGALLSAAYEEIAARHERTGGDGSKLHRPLLEEVLYGCDVMPSAVHITGSTLSGLAPGQGFDLSRLYTLAYGRQPDGDVRLGSLELLRASELRALFNTSDPALRTGSAGQETSVAVTTEIRDGDFDLVIMNPPFTRNVTREGATAGATAAAFAAFDASESDQRDMAKRMGRLRRGDSYHGNAGIASAFADLADRKLRPGGVIALVLPLSAASGQAWQGFRRMLAERYTGLTVVSIAANGARMSFSSDTGMAECLVVARKRRDGEASDENARFVSLNERPGGFPQAAALARTVESTPGGRHLRDGPYGGDVLQHGDDRVGELVIASPSSSSSNRWSCVRVADAAVAQTAFALSEGRLHLPGDANALPLPMTRLAEIADLGLYHLDIIGRPPRGPFQRLAASPTATYPALWNHHARRENRLVVAPDSQLQVRRGMEAKASRVWATASRAHLNLDFTFGAQCLAVAVTEDRAIGGRVWPNVRFADQRFDWALSAWSNGTLGLVAHWWHANRQQSSKAGVTVRSAEDLPVLDFRELDDDRLEGARLIFDEFRDLDLQPAYLADTDPNRALLDRRVVCDLLGFDEDTFRGVRRLAAKWCAEPSVHGGKKRPAAKRSFTYRFEQAEEYALVAEPVFEGFRKA